MEIFIQCFYDKENKIIFAKGTQGLTCVSTSNLYDAMNDICQSVGVIKVELKNDN